MSAYAAIQRITVIAVLSAVLLVGLVVFAGWARTAPAYDPGLMPTSEPQVPPMAWPAAEPAVPSAP